MGNQEEELIFEILRNFEDEFKQYQKNQTGKIKTLFDKRNINAKYLKT